MRLRAEKESSNLLYKTGVNWNFHENTKNTDARLTFVAVLYYL